MKGPDDRMVELTTRPNEAMAGIVRAVLDDAGIESYLSVGGGVMANAEFGLSFVPTTVYVNSGDLQRAKEILDAARLDSIDIDWSEVDVGEGDWDEEVTPEKAAVYAKRRRLCKHVLLFLIILFLGYVLLQVLDMVNGVKSVI